MKVRQTSIDCYNEIKANGLLPKRRLQAYEALMKIAPCTASELQRYIGYNNGGRDCMKRLSELRDSGAIYEVRTRACSVTGKNVIEWDLTDNLPVKIKKQTNTKSDRKNKALESLRRLYKNMSNETFKNVTIENDWTEVADLIKDI